tara:strand:- start:217 stop:1800 length:1584 start_codon:yes stop_codon:yes gene_type:complete
MAGYLGAIPVPQATQNRESFTASADQTSFATAGYTVGFVDVFLNGVRLNTADFTATNGSDIVLAANAAVNDILDVISYATFEVNAQTFTGTTTLTDVVAASLDISGNIDIDGITNLDVVDIDGAVNIAAATTIATNNKIQFRDTAIYLNSSADGQLDIVADTEIQIAATTIDIDGAVALNGAITGATNITLSGELDAATGDFSGAVDIAGDLTLSAGGDGALRFSGASSIKMLDNSATSLVFEEADNAYMTFVTTNSSETIRFGKKVAVNCAGEAASMVEVNAGADGAVALSARADGGNGNNRRFNLVPFASGGTYGGGLKIQTRNTSNVFANTLTLDHAYGATIANGLTLTDGNLTVAAGHGIVFGDANGLSATTPSSNTLDDFEEGVYDATWQSSGNSSTVLMRAGYRNLSYVKIGSLVTVTGRYEVSSDTTLDGNLKFTLPFTIANGLADQGDTGVGTISINRSGGNGGAIVSGHNLFQAVGFPGESVFYVYYQPTGAVNEALVQGSNVDTGFEGYVHFQYRTN